MIHTNCKDSSAAPTKTIPVDGEENLIKKALMHTSEDKLQASKILGLSIKALNHKIQEYKEKGSVYFKNLS